MKNDLGIPGLENVEFELAVGLGKMDDPVYAILANRQSQPFIGLHECFSIIRELDFPDGEVGLLLGYHTRRAIIIPITRRPL